MDIPLSTALDILLAVLLTFTIGYAVILNRRLGNLRNDKKKLAHFTASFTKATMRAEESINLLKGSADDLSKHITMAQSLRDDLSFLIERGDLEADRLEEKVRSLRNKTATVKTSAGKTATGKTATGKTSTGKTIRGSSSMTAGASQGAQHLKSEAERELLRALQSVR